MEPILSISNLSKHYGPVRAVNNVSFTIQKGFVYGILGPNGSGKSTTLGMVLNVINPTSGNYRWFDGNVDNHDALKRIGAIIERPNFYPSMSAYQNLQLVCKIKNIPTDKILEKLQVVDLIGRKDSPFSTFSLGMKQRLAIASALLNDPEILILDEPTNGLDPQGIRKIRDIIQHIASTGTTILLASHLLDEVEKVCSHVIVLRNGHMIYNGLVDEMSKNYGRILIDAADKTQLESFIKQHDYFGSYETSSDGYEVVLLKEIDTAQLNEQAFKSGLILSRLSHKKQSLEDQFIELTNNN